MIMLCPPALSGNVTSVALTLPGFMTISGSPITTSGTLAIGLATQAANLLFAGPTTGGAAAPTFRTLVPADLPTMVGDSGSGGAKGAVPAPGAGDTAAGKFLKADGTWAVPTGSGTVTSVGLSGPSEFSISGSPVTGTGTLTFSKSNQAANTVWAGPTIGGAAAPTFRALDPADLPNHSAALITTGTLSVLRGGTGLTSGTSGGLVYFNGGSSIDCSALAAQYKVLIGGGAGNPPYTLSGIGTAGQVLTSNGTGADPSWQNAGSGTVTSVAMTVPGFLSVSGTPITGSGTLAVTLANQNANTVFCGPTSGGAATPTFRSLVAGDVPSLDAAKITTGTFAKAMISSTGTWSAAEIPNHSAALLTSGTVAVARLPGMIASGASHAAGIVPDPGSSAGSTKFLREDATWAVPAGGGGGGSPAGSNTQVQFNNSGSFGANAGFFFDPVNDNYVMGSGAAASIGSGTDLIAIGTNAAAATTVGGLIAIGKQSLLIATAAGSVAVGDNTLLNNVGGAGANTAFGYAAGASLTSGDTSTFLGNGADVASGNQVNSTAIGFGSICPSSNYVQLGNASCSGGIANDFSVGGNLKIASLAGVLTASAGIVSATTPVADGTYTTGIGGTQNGTITITNGVITAIQEAI